MIVRVLILAVIISFIPISALAEGFIKAAGSNDYDSFVSAKLISAGVQRPFFHVFDYQLESGVITDINRPFNGTTFFAGPSIGVSVVNQGGYYAKTFFGPAYVSRTDDRLSTPYEFNTDMEVGIKDKRGASIGLGFKHLSNAGIEGQNLGRDFIFIKVGF